MIEFKLINHNLYGSQWEWIYNHETSSGHYIHHPIIPGMKVCTKLNIIGVITHIGDKVYNQTPYKTDADQQIRVYHKEVTVLWLTGKKRGKSEVKDTDNLTHFKSYKDAVAAHLEEIEGYELEANAFGV